MDIDSLFDQAQFKNPAQDTASEYSVYEGHDLIKNGDVIAQPDTKPVKAETLKTIVDAREWLPFAAEVYNISPDISDYLIVPVEIIRSDLPNRNGIAMPLEELLRFHQSIGMQSYKSWTGQPTHFEHQNNTVNEKAKGVIISTAVRNMTGVKGNFIKLMHLLAFDRKKDPWLAKEISERRRTGYSMGSSCDTYTCSICNADMRDRGYCDHIDVRTKKDKANMRMLFGNRLAYPMSRGIKGFECSSVNTPAYHHARTSNILIDRR